MHFRINHYYSLVSLSVLLQSVLNIGYAQSILAQSSQSHKEKIIQRDEKYITRDQNELIKLNQKLSTLEAMDKIFDYIEVFYNRKRLHSFLNFVSPEQFEKSVLMAA